jgi:hypothetical protein
MRKPVKKMILRKSIWLFNQQQIFTHQPLYYKTA